jgi:hypothetical protein
MKKRGLLIAAVLFFFLINASYFIEELLPGLWDMDFAFVLII